MVKISDKLIEKSKREKRELSFDFKKQIIEHYLKKKKII